MAKSIPVHLIISERVMKTLAKGSYGHTTQERIDRGTYLQTKTTTQGFYLRQEIVILDQTIYDNLDVNGIKLLIQIQQELKVNNPIWKCRDTSKTQVRLALSQLKQKDILEPIGDSLYIVNPIKIRRGKPLACLTALYTYCKRKWERDRTWRLTESDIRNLLSPEEHQFEELTGEISNVDRPNTIMMSDEEFCEYVRTVEATDLTPQELSRLHRLDIENTNGEFIESVA